MNQRPWPEPIHLFIGVAILIGAALYAPGTWPALLSFIKSAPALLAITLIPGWVMLFVAPFVVFVVAVIYFIVATGNVESGEPAFTAYRRDSIFDIDWAWRWLPPDPYNTHYNLGDLTPHCPSCCTVLAINEQDNCLVSCINDSCAWQWPRRQSQYAFIRTSIELDRKVRQEIARRLSAKER